MESLTAPVPKSVAECAKVFTKILKEGGELKITDLFNQFITEVKTNIFKGEGSFCPICFFIFRDYDKKIWKAGCYPLMPISLDGVTPISMEMHSFVLKKTIKEMKTAEQKEFKLVGVMMAMDSHMKRYDRGEITDKMGNLDKNKFIRPSQDPTALDVLRFDLEEIFVKHTKAFQYIQSQDGNFVFDEKPMIDTKKPFDEVEDKNSNFGYLFTEGMRMN